MPECTKSTAWILNENMHKDKFMKYSKRKEKEKNIYIKLWQYFEVFHKVKYLTVAGVAFFQLYFNYDSIFLILNVNYKLKKEKNNNHYIIYCLIVYIAF